jgi:hypothetical protein
MDKIQEQLSSFFIGLYAWMLTVFFGMVLLDMIYSRLVAGAGDAFSKVSDFLLVIGFITLLLSVAAIVSSWKSKAGRVLLIASLLVMLFEFLIPVVFSSFVRNDAGLAIGPWLRLLPTGLASILAFIGLYKCFQR